MTPFLPLESGNYFVVSFCLQKDKSSESCELKDIQNKGYFSQEGYFYFFICLLFTVNSLACELLSCRLASQVLGMPARKMRVEVFDESGNRYTITFEGQVTREKAIRLLDLVELLGGIPESPEWESAPSKLTKVDRVRQVVERRFPLVWFTAREVQSVYEQEFKESIGLSTASTYLSRMADRGILVKSGMSNRKRYRIMTKTAGHALGFIKSNK